MRSLERVLALLEAVADAGSLAPARAATKIGLSLSTVARVMREMAQQQLLDREADGSYRLGERFYHLLVAAGRHGDPAVKVRAVLGLLRDRHGETVTLHVLRNGFRVCVAVQESHHGIRRVVPVGEANPLLNSATGEVLLSGAIPEVRQREMEKNGLSPAQVREVGTRLEQIAKEGWALVVNKWVPDITGLSVPIRQGSDTVAALTISGPSYRFTRAAALKCLPDMQAGAAELGRLQSLPTALGT